MRFPVFILAVLPIAAAAMLTPTRADAQQGKAVNFHTLTRYEAHTQNGNSDFFYGGVFMTRKLQPKFDAIASYLNKYDLDSDQTESHIFNLTVVDSRSSRFKVTYAYSHYSNPDNKTTRPVGNDSDRWLLMGQESLNASKTRPLTLSGSFSSGTDFSDSRTASAKLKYGVPLARNLKAAVYGQYSYSMNLSDNVFNMYGLDLNYTMGKRTRLSANYLFIDMQDATIDDDDIVQVGVFQTYK